MSISSSYTVTTVPSPPVQSTNFDITFFDDLDLQLFSASNTYTFTIDSVGFTDYVISDANTITFNNVSSGVSGDIPYSLTSDPSTDSYNDTLTVEVICYAKGTKILCINDDKEIYIPIEYITEGSLIKTYKHGPKIMIAKLHLKFRPSLKPGTSALYKLPQHEMAPNVPFEDLYVSGGHSILVDNIDEATKLKLIKVWGKNYCMVLDGKNKVLACCNSDLFDHVKDTTLVDIYQIILENDNPAGHYGVYANGVLSETTCQAYLSKYKSIFIAPKI